MRFSCDVKHLPWPLHLLFPLLRHLLLTDPWLVRAQFEMFLKNSFGVLFFTFFLFQSAMSSLAFLVSTAVSKASTGTNLGFAVFLVGWIMQVWKAALSLLSERQRAQTLEIVSRLPEHPPNGP